MMAKRLRRQYWVLGIFLIALGLASGLISLAGRLPHLDQAVQVMFQVKLRYVEPVSLPDLFQAFIRTKSIDGMLATLGDPYTRFLPAAEYREFRDQTEGTFGGIGVIFDPQTNIIIRTIKDSPGDAAGLRRGDRIYKVNGRLASKMTGDAVARNIRGPVGTVVHLAIERGQGAEAAIFEIAITRATIELPSVEYELVNDHAAGRIAFITLSQFTSRTGEELRETLDGAERDGVRGVVLDLRYNPGGLLDAAIDVASQFLPDGVAMYMVKRGGPRETFYVRKGFYRHSYPLVVLVNGWSASASEIVAGALKDRGAATLVGSKTYGKGVVQEIVPVTGGAALSVTVAKYLTAGGHSINKRGIIPDVTVDFPGAMERAMKSGKIDELARLERLQRERAMEIIRGKVAARRAS